MNKLRIIIEANGVICGTGLNPSGLIPVGAWDRSGDFMLWRVTGRCPVLRYIGPTAHAFVRMDDFVVKDDWILFLALKGRHNLAQGNAL